MHQYFERSRILIQFLGNIKLLFSEKSATSSSEQFKKIVLFRLPLIAKRCAGDKVEKLGVWSNGTVVFDLHMESASCLKLSISNLIIVFLV